MKKVLGYILSLAGLAGLAVFGIKGVSDKIGISIPSFLPAKYLIIACVLIAAVGVLLISTDSSSIKQAKEVPIYEGNKIVGYRRQK